ncbi:MAG: hypothetical protein GQ532_18305 [Methylomarinum sp.]|nr:hypothetical protein [Methylomarinum sp.]
MSLTKEQWETLEKELDRGSWGEATLKLDNDTINLQRVFISKNTIAIGVYINGTIKPGWGVVSLDMFDPKVKQLWRKRTKSLYGGKRKQEFIKVFGIRRARKEFDIDKKTEWYEPYFPTFGGLKRLYKKNENLELICVGYNKAGAA